MTVTAGAATPLGAYTITITGSSGSLTHSTTVTAFVVMPVAAGASFSQADTQTQGTWKGVYGADGFSIANDVTSYPGYAQVGLSGQQSATWAAVTTAEWTILCLLSTPMCAFMPKYHCFPLRVWCISGSRFCSRFLVELGA